MLERFAFVVLLCCACAGAAAQVPGRISLDGEWQFAVDTAAVFGVNDVAGHAQWRTIVVPLSWQAQFPDLREYQGVAWYRKRIALPAPQRGDVVLLRFGAVDYSARVYVNGKLAGSHEGGYLPFEFEIAPLMQAGENEILIRVMDPVSGPHGTEGVRYGEIPHGKQSWYIQTSGIWQSAAVEYKAACHIERLQATPSVDGRVSIAFQIRGDGAGRQVDLTIKENNGTVVDAWSVRPAQGEQLISIERRIQSPKLWSPDTPELYTIEAVISNGGGIVERFGFRSFEARDGGLYLNGQPFYLMGALDQDFYPETVSTPPSEDYLRDEMIKAKRMGLNTLRCHIKVPDPRYLALADELGLVLWCEIPNWDVLTPDAMRRAEETFDGMLARDWSHPSLCILSIINESWGIDLQKADQRAWLRSAFDRAKQKAVGRVIVDNSACWGNFHIKTDINDYHTYWAIPEHAERYDWTLQDFASRPAWLFSPFGDAEQNGREPLVLSEFGNWGLPNLPQSTPWWYGKRFGDAEVVLPLGVEDRFRAYGYDRIFGTYARLAEESQRSQWEALKYEIERMRLVPQIRGYIITEFTDINWECNGLLDMWRNPKVVTNEIGKIQRQDVVVISPERTNLWSGDTVRMAVHISRFGPVELAGASIRWKLSTGGEGTIPVPAIDRGCVAHAGAVTFAAPKVAAPVRLIVECELVLPSGIVHARNDAAIFVYPPVMLPAGIRLELHDPAGVLAHLRNSLFCPCQPEGMPGDVIITDVIDDYVRQRLDNGAAVLCLVDTTTALPAGFPAAITRRESPWYDGDWASNLNWIDDTREPFSALPSGKHLGFEGSAVAPGLVLTGISPADFQDAAAGMYIGWLHLNSASVLRLNTGTGRLALCTFRLADAGGTDPYAASLLARLIAWTSDRTSKPGMSWTPR